MKELVDVEVEIEEFPSLRGRLAEILPVCLQVLAFGLDDGGGEMFVGEELGAGSQSRVQLGLVTLNLLLQHPVLLFHALRLEQVFTDRLDRKEGGRGREEERWTVRGAKNWSNSIHGY